MAILTNKPSSISADSTTSLELNKAELQTKLEALNAGAYWEDQNTWKGVAFSFKNANNQRIIAVFDVSAGNTTNISLSEFFVDGNILCDRIDVLGFANDNYTIFREDFTTASEFDIEITGGYVSGGGNGQSDPDTIALYRFNGNGLDVNGNNLVIVGSPSYASGKFNQGVTGFSSSNYFKTNRNTSENPMGDIGSSLFTIECWVKLVKTNSDDQVIFRYGSIEDLQHTIALVHTGDGRIGLLSAHTNTSSVVELESNLVSASAYENDNTFHHVAVQKAYDQNGQKTKLNLFIDGTFVGSSIFGIDLQLGQNVLTVDISLDNQFPLNIGYDPITYAGSNTAPAFAGTAFQGTIDELRISGITRYVSAPFSPPNSPLN